MSQAEKRHRQGNIFSFTKAGQNRWTAKGEEDDEKRDRFRDPTENSNDDNLMFLKELATLSGWMVRVICHSKVIKV